MSTITSSAINKSGKTVAPKAAARRRPAERDRQPPHSAQDKSSDRTSQDATHQEASSISSNIRPSVNLDDNGTVPALTTTLPQSEPSPTASRPQRSRKSTAKASQANDGNRGNGTTIRTTSAGDAEQTEQRAENVLPRTGAAQLAGSKRKRAGGRVARDTPQGVMTDVGAASVPATAIVDGIVEEAGVTPHEQNASLAPRQTSPDPTGTAGDTGDSGAATQVNVTITPKPPRKRRKNAQAAPRPEGGEQADGNGNENQDTAIRREDGTARSAEPPRPSRKPRQRKRQQAATDQAEPGSAGGQADNAQSDAAAQEGDGEEEDPENIEIDIETTTMSRLTRNIATGKTSEREKAMQEIDWDEVARKRREGVPATVEVNVQQAEGAAQAESTPRTQAVQLRIVNGEIVIDENSQQIDRQAQAIADAENLVVNENDDLTKRVNTMSWINAKKRDPAERIAYKMKSDPWSDEETDRFYEALRMFGTDFFIISKMFPPKTRRQIKLKFVREERLDPVRLNAALSGQAAVPMDLKHYAEATGVDETEFKDPTIVTAELAKDLKEQEKNIAEKKAEMAEALKQKELMDQQRDKEKQEREKERAVQKEQRNAARRRKKGARGNEVAGTGTL